MKIEAVDFFYLSMPVVTDAGDGSQDALVVRVAAGGHVGWGECEASPLVSIAAYVCPMSHGACRPVVDSVLGQDLSSPEDIARIAADLELNSMDLLQTPHTFSGIEMAMWDLLGRKQGRPVWHLLGYPQAFPKTPYASMLFGDDPTETLERAGGGRRCGVPRDQMRLGPVWTQHTCGRCGSASRRARRSWPGRHPSGRCRADLARRCRGGGPAPAGAGTGPHNLAGRAVSGPCL